MAVSVFPTPVGPTNRNDPIGRPVWFNPIRFLLIARDILSIASSCPITAVFNLLSKLRNWVFSCSCNSLTGILVFSSTMFSISLTVTVAASSGWGCSSASFLAFSNWLTWSR